MIQTMTKKFARISAVAMVAALCFVVSAMALTSGTYPAGLYQDAAATTASHANAAVAGDAAVVVNGDTATITVPLQPIVYYGQVGYITGASTSVAGCTATADATTLTVTVPAGFDPATDSLLIAFDVTIVGSEHTNTSNAYLALR